MFSIGNIENIVYKKENYNYLIKVNNQYNIHLHIQNFKDSLCLKLLERLTIPQHLHPISHSTILGERRYTKWRLCQYSGEHSYTLFLN